MLSGDLMGDSKLGEILFVAGVLIALAVGLLAGLVPAITANLAAIYVVLAILGLLVGLMNINPKEAPGFLIASIALLGFQSISNSLEPVFVGPLAGLEAGVSRFLGAVAVFVAPAALVVALIYVYQMASRQEESSMVETVELPAGMMVAGKKTVRRR